MPRPTPGVAGAAPRWPRARRIALLAAAIALIPVAVSYIGAVTQPSNSSLGILTVEWLRDHGARGIVNSVENLYYSMNAPATGGPGLHGLPQQAGVAITSTHSRRRHAAYRPRALAPIIRPALPGEGVWHAPFAPARSRPPVLITSFRPDPAYPRVVAGVAWIDHARTSTWLYPGRDEPAVAMPSRGPMEVPLAKRSSLVATFNSGFKLADSAGGYADGGHTYAPLHSGAATFVRYRDGRVDILRWTGGPTAGPEVTYARQNLPLIVDGGAPNPNLSDGPAWGATLGNAVRVWRSAVGVDARGNLIYAAADAQTVHSMAEIMIHARAVRAMELDINAYWPSFITYRTAGAGGPANLLPGMQRSRFRYLSPDDRDFFAVYLR